LAIAGCGGPTAATDAAPALDRQQAEAIVLRGDDLLRSARAGSGAEVLASSFHDPALGTLSLEATRLAQRGLQIQERDTHRTLVFFDAHGLEAVLDIRSQHRLVAPDQLDPPWAATERQWWVSFGFAVGKWWLVDQHDLTPDRWFTVH
jgi:hypothetical protein